MSEFLSAVLAFPTVLFTIPVGLSVLYWLFVVIGAVDIDAFGFGGVLEGGVDGVLDGALDGAADGLLSGGLDGAADGLLDGASEGLFGGGLDGAADGLLEGMLDAGVDGAADAASEALGEGASEAASVEAGRSLFFDMLSGLRLTSVPITVSMSFIALFGWVLCYLGMAWLPTIITGSPLLLSLGVAAGAFFLGTGTTSIAIRPLGRFFASHDARGNKSLVGLSAVLTTGRVDANFGQAEVHDRGDSILVQVRCDRPATLKRGDELLLVQFDRKREAFVVEPLPSVLASGDTVRKQTSQEAGSSEIESTAPRPAVRELE